MWQQDRTDPDRTRCYREIRRKVSKAVHSNKRNWWGTVVSGMEEDMRAHRYASFFRRMRKFVGTEKSHLDVLLDKDGNEIGDRGAQLKRWQEYFEELLNVD